QVGEPLIGLRLGVCRGRQAGRYVFDRDVAIAAQGDEKTRMCGAKASGARSPLEDRLQEDRAVGRGGQDPRNGEGGDGFSKSLEVGGLTDQRGFGAGLERELEDGARVT